jgi:outer membrane protease
LLRIAQEQIAPSQNKDALSSLRIVIQTGLMNVRVKELVFDQDRKISEIDWKLRTVFSPGVVLGFQLNERWDLRLGYKLSANQGSGDVTDSDFDRVAGEKTKFSKHQPQLIVANHTDFKVGYTFIRNQPATLTGILGYSLRRTKMVARNGFVEDPPGAPHKEVYGTGIAYDQIYQIPYTGIAFYYMPSQKLAWGISTLYSQWVGINTLDNHFKRNLDFYDKIKGGTYYAVKPSVHWQTGRNSILSLSLEYTKLKEEKGDSYSFDTSTGEKSPTRENGAGVSFDTYDVVIAWTAFIK